MRRDMEARLRAEHDFEVFVAGDGENAIRMMSEGERREAAAQEIERLRRELLTLARSVVSHPYEHDLGGCPYLLRGLPGHDPKGICDRGCWEEPRCHTEMPTEDWPLHLALTAIADHGDTS